MVLIFFVLSQDDLKIANSEKRDIIRGVPSKLILASLQRIYLDVFRNVFFIALLGHNTFIL